MKMHAPKQTARSSEEFHTAICYASNDYYSINDDTEKKGSPADSVPIHAGDFHRNDDSFPLRNHNGWV